MNGMFQDCCFIINISVKNFDTSNVKEMSCMFCKCRSIKNLDLSNFNTNKVENMQAMFLDCKDGLIKKIRTKYKNFKEEVF